MLGFILGALAGGIAATYWSGGSGRLREHHLPRLRNQAADKVDAAERAIIDLVRNVSARTRTTLRDDGTAAGRDARSQAPSATIVRQ